MEKIDNFLNDITMYRVMLYGLCILAVIAIIFGFLGVISYSGFSLFLSLVVIIFACFTTNLIFAKIFRAPTNVESSWITGFILFFILSPITISSIFPFLSLSTFSKILIFILVGTIAMASKYILAIGKKHIFNAVAISLFVIGLFGLGIGIWWIASPAMLGPVAFLGFFILRKTRRFSLFFAFLVPAYIAILVFAFLNHVVLSSLFLQVFTSWPIIFFGTIMLTEPLTTPPYLRMQVIYGILVGVLFGSQFSFGPVYSTPEFALIVGNIFAYIVSPKQKLMLELTEKKKIASNIFEFIFTSPQVALRKFYFKPGQYLEWTLAHSHPDTRGNRRYFTIASSPTEDTIRLGIRTDPLESSSFKKKLVSMKKGDLIVASQLAGEFTMPIDHHISMVWIAGGIGVTPFRSMLMYLLDKNAEQKENNIKKNKNQEEIHNITLFYSNKTFIDIAYADILDRAERELGVKVVVTLTDMASLPPDWQGETGFVDRRMIARHVVDPTVCMYYISGPHNMVTAYETVLAAMNVRSSHIKSDFFPGFA